MRRDCRLAESNRKCWATSPPSLSDMPRLVREPCMPHLQSYLGISRRFAVQIAYAHRGCGTACPVNYYQMSTSTIRPLTTATMDSITTVTNPFTVQPTRNIHRRRQKCPEGHPGRLYSAIFEAQKITQWALVRQPKGAPRGSHNRTTGAKKKHVGSKRRWLVPERILRERLACDGGTDSWGLLCTGARWGTWACVGG